MLLEYLQNRYLNKKIKKFKRPLKKTYGKKLAKYNMLIVKIVYRSLAYRYGLTPKRLWKLFPLKVKRDKELEDDYCYGVCETEVIERKKIFSGGKITKYYATIGLNPYKITPTTFIHEFGHYIMYLIMFICGEKEDNYWALEDFIIITDIIRSRENVYLCENDNFLKRGDFTEEETENFAKIWEKYIRPSAK